MTTNLKPTPHRAESLGRLRMRFGWAVNHVHDVASIVAGREPDPSFEPHHVFDLDGGLRLIAIVYRNPDGRVHTQVSASWSGEPLKTEFVSGGISPLMFVELARSGYRDLSRDARLLKFHGFLGPKGVPIWTIDGPAVAAKGGPPC